jgi:hypothetical protein
LKPRAFQQSSVHLLHSEEASDMSSMENSVPILLPSAILKQTENARNQLKEKQRIIKWIIRIFATRNAKSKALQRTEEQILGIRYFAKTPCSRKEHLRILTAVHERRKARERSGTSRIFI